MTDEKRTCIAAIAYVAITRKVSNAIFDYQRNRYINLGIRCNNRLFNVYDYDRAGFIGGYLPNLYDYVSNTHIQLTINGRNFSGYDYETAAYYNGYVSGSVIQLFDFDRSTYYSYSM